MIVSVIVPCRNAEPYLAQALGSALDQRHPPSEIIVVDDGSTDGSLAIARRFEARDRRVRVLAERFGRASRARNLGASVARGDALMFLDADDVLGPETLHGLTAALADAPGGVAACPWYRLELIEGRWRARPWSCTPRRPEQDALSAWLTGWYYPPCALLWSRTAFEGVGRWDEQSTVNDDGNLMMRALVRRTPLIEGASGAAYYRRLPGEHGSLSATRRTPEGLASRLRDIRKVACQLEECGRLDAYRDALLRACALVMADARGRSTDLQSEAEAFARSLRPAARGRAMQRLRQLGRRVRRRTPPKARHEDARPDLQDEEVRFGLERAAAVLRSPVALGPARGVPFARLPAVTVVIPTYNRAHLLGRAVRSVLSQTFRDFELVVVDDGSTDDTGAVVAAFRDPRVRLVRQPRNRGVGAARNRGLREARTPFIAFLDSDDEWLPDKLERQIALFRTAPEELGLVYTGVETVEADGAAIVECTRRRGDVYREMLLKNVIHGGGSNAMIRREVVAAAGFFDETIPAIEDYEYWLRVTRFFRVDYVDAPLVRYHGGGQAQRRSLARQANRDARARLFERHAAELRRAGVAHLFLLESVRRALKPPDPDLPAARRLAFRALLEAPGSRRTLGALRQTFFPRQRARRPTVLFYSETDPAEAGGVQRVLDQAASQAAAQGCRVVRAWAARDPQGGADECCALPRLRWRRGLPTPGSLLRAAGAMVRLSGLLIRHRPAIVNLHYVTGAAAYFVLARPFFGYRLVLSAHGSDVFRPRPWDEPLLPRALRSADAVTAVCAATADRLVRMSGVDPSRLRLIPNGVDRRFWSAARPADEVGCRAPTILAVGRLHPVKGHDVLLRALAAIRLRIPEARLVIAGEGRSREDLERLASALDVSPAVELRGQVTAEGVRALMGEARVFVLPSRSEGLPLALLEAMAAGLPVVATRVGGIPDVLLDGGLLVEPDDPVGLADAIARILEDATLASSLSRGALERAGQLPGDPPGGAYVRLFTELARPRRL